MTQNEFTEEMADNVRESVKSASSNQESAAATLLRQAAQSGMTPNYGDPAQDPNLAGRSATISPVNQLPTYQQPEPNIAQSNNPLSGFFRAPGKSIKIPSQGRFNQGSIDFSLSGEIDIFAMTAKDEIILKSPDALLNGNSIISVVKSCAPAIKDPINLPMIDIDAILIAIHSVSYGDKMDIQSKCSKCNNVDDFSINISPFIDYMNFIEDGDFNIKLKNGLRIELKPYTLQSSIRMGLVAFEEQRLINSLSKDDLNGNVEISLDKFGLFTKTYNTVGDIADQMISDSIVNIITPDNNVVSNKQFIYDWVTHSPMESIKSIKDILENSANRGMNNNVELECSKCHHTEKREVEYDPSSFFGMK